MTIIDKIKQRKLEKHLYDGTVFNTRDVFWVVLAQSKKMECGIEHLERFLIVPIIFNKDETAFKNLFTERVFKYDKKDIHKFDELKKSVGMIDAVDCLRDSINMSKIGFKHELFGDFINKKTVLDIAKRVADFELKQTRQYEKQDIKRAKIEDKQKIVKEQTRNF